MGRVIYATNNTNNFTMITKKILQTKPFKHFYFSVEEFQYVQETFYNIWLHSGLDKRSVLYAKTNNFIKVLREIHSVIEPILSYEGDIDEDFALH